MILSVRALAFAVALSSTAIPVSVYAQQASPPPAASAPAECANGNGVNPMAGIQLTPVQRQQIRSLRAAFRAQYPCGSRVPKEAREQLRQEILSVLTPAQQAQYEANLKQP